MKGAHVTPLDPALSRAFHPDRDVTRREVRERRQPGPSSLWPNVARVAPGKDAMREKLKEAGWSDGALMEMVRAAVRLEPSPRKS